MRARWSCRWIQTSSTWVNRTDETWKLTKVLNNKIKSYYKTLSFFTVYVLVVSAHFLVCPWIIFLQCAPCYNSYSINIIYISGSVSILLIFYGVFLGDAKLQLLFLQCVSWSSLIGLDTVSHVSCDSLTAQQLILTVSVVYSVINEPLTFVTFISYSGSSVGYVSSAGSDRDH